jgi:Ni/Fe-hydrogenase subunit HybB-like protein
MMINDKGIAMKHFLQFLSGSLKLMVKGSRAYYAWLAFLVLLSLYGLVGVFRQFGGGLILTNMRDQVSWAYYIGNFTFLVGVAAAAVMLVIPAYIYDWKPIKEIAILGELLAISAVIMCLGFVIVDIGRPDRFWHLIPFLGLMNFPDSLLAWDVLVLTGYLLLNLFIVGYLLNSSYHNRPYKKSVVYPLVILSIPMAVSIHTVTAFLYNGLAARPFWNASILAPRFLASAFCSGPAILLIILQILRRTTHLEIKKEAIWKIAELMAYAMAFNLFLLGAEVFKEFYSAAEHVVYIKYLFFGLEGHNAIVPYAWISVIASIIALVLFLVPRTRKNPVTMNIGAALILIGVYIEKGVGLVVPGLTPDTLGEIYEYFPSGLELQIALGIFALGFLVFTLLIKVAVPISMGRFHQKKTSPVKTK